MNMTVTATKPPESKAEKFRRLGQSRTVRAIKAIRLVGGLANRALYEWEAEAEEAKILGALAEELDKLRDAFEAARNGRKSSDITFEL